MEPLHPTPAENELAMREWYQVACRQDRKMAVELEHTVFYISLVHSTP